MNPQLSVAMAHSHQHDLHLAAERSRNAAGLSTGSNLTTRLRASISALRTQRSAQSPARKTAVTA